MPDLTPCDDDSNACTKDICQNGACEHPNEPDGQPCPDDGEECTDDECLSGSCGHPAKSDGTPCTDDGEFCTDDVCGGGSCTHPALPDGLSCPDDGEECTDDECQGGSCQHPAEPDGIACTDDGEFCTDDVCGGGSCTHPAHPDGTACPSDGEICTDDICQSGSCAHPAKSDGSPCFDDENLCTEDKCQSGVCGHPPRPDGTPCIDDQNECTLDECSGGGCTHPPVTNGTLCTDDGNECTLDQCIEGACQHPPDPTPCKACGSPGDRCLNFACVAPGCTIDGPRVAGCPGNSIAADVELGCVNGCPTETVAVSADPMDPDLAHFSVTGGNVGCPGGTVSLSITIGSGAPAGDFEIDLLGTGPGGSTCSGKLKVTVMGSDPEIIESTAWLVVHDPIFEQDHCQSTSVPPCQQAELMTNVAEVWVSKGSCDGAVPEQDFAVSLWEDDFLSSDDFIVNGFEEDSVDTIRFRFDTTVGSTTGGAKTDANGAIYIEGAQLPEGPSSVPAVSYLFKLFVDRSLAESTPVVIAPILTDLSYSPDILANPPNTVDPYSDLFSEPSEFGSDNCSVSFPPLGYDCGEGFGLTSEYDLDDDISNFSISLSNNPDNGTPGDIVNGVYGLLIDDSALMTSGIINKKVKWEGFIDNSEVIDTAGHRERANEVFMDGMEAERSELWPMGDQINQVFRGMSPGSLAKEGDYWMTFQLARSNDGTQVQELTIPLTVKYEFE